MEALDCKDFIFQKYLISDKLRELLISHYTNLFIA
jgi:hypothetical protein